MAEWQGREASRHAVLQQQQLLLQNQNQQQQQQQQRQPCTAAAGSPAAEAALPLEDDVRLVRSYLPSYAGAAPGR